MWSLVTQEIGVQILTELKCFSLHGNEEIWLGELIQAILHCIKGSGHLRPKTISAWDSSAQIDFFTGTPRPGTPWPSYENALFVANNGKQMYI